ncbi:hypothetical protein OC842_005206 [Tilletia horrida]|uniref:Uncharacterized protein n=1 Tax=Tilletia horrida TaxID=155126 RepID=A0AAN6G868_9BASI|nr:hypothetical protein OC842_005206 [Tilletia horrida]
MSSSYITSPKAHSSLVKTVKLPTHLSLSADVVLGGTSTMNNTHTIESLLIDITETINHLDLVIWTRNQIESGSVPDAPSLPSGTPSVNFLAVIKDQDQEGKTATLVGRQYMGKNEPAADFEFVGIFEDLPRWENWRFSGVGSVVSGEGLFNRVREDGLLEVLMRRCTLVCDATAPVRQALGIGAGSPKGKVNALLKAHQLLQKNKQGTLQASSKDNENDDDSDTSKSSDQSSMLDSKLKARNLDNATDGEKEVSGKSAPAGPMPSTHTTHQEHAAATTGLLTRKRARNE